MSEKTRKEKTNILKNLDRIRESIKIPLLDFLGENESQPAEMRRTTEKPILGSESPARKKRREAKPEQPRHTHNRKINQPTTVKPDSQTENYAVKKHRGPLDYSSLK